jgi:N-acyl-D-aspartate/D-glutamate deacylase
MAGLLVRGGQLIDGTGAPAVRADVLVRDGRIAAIGADLPAGDADIIEADGAIVAPGFIDCHTHFDASLFWDPRCDPMPEHGVTTVMIGNCSLGLAPVTPASRDEIADVFSYIEDIPRDLFSSMVPWNWSDFGDYAEELGRRRFAVNVVGLVPHSWLRTFAMGADAWQRAATAQEIATIADQVERALQAGARGLSTSLFDKDSGGRLVPSALADDAELGALFEILGQAGGIAQLIPRHPRFAEIGADLRRFGALSRRHGVPVLVNAITDPVFDPDHAGLMLDQAAALQADGAPVYPMLSPNAVEMTTNFHGSISFSRIPAWNDLIQAPAAEKRRRLADPAWREGARGDWDRSGSMLCPTKRPAAMRIIAVGEKPALAGWIGRSFADLVATRGGHPSDVMADWVIETDFGARFVYPLTNQRPEVVGRLLRDDAVIVGASDAGAHFQAFCGAGDTTLLLTRHVRERGDLTIEQAVRGLTGRQAQLLGLKDRGVVRVGAIADLVIFDLAELQWLPDTLVRDVPGNIARLRRPPGGYRYTIVGGEIVQANGRSIDALPGCFLGAADRCRACPPDLITA